MKKVNLSSRAWKELQRNTASKESYDCFDALVGTWWALRRAEKSERKMIQALERIAETEKAIARIQQGDTVSTNEAHFGDAGSPSPLIASSAQGQAQTTDGDGTGKYVVLYGVMLVLQPLLAMVLYAAVFWGFWNVFLWLFLS